MTFPAIRFLLRLGCVTALCISSVGIVRAQFDEEPETPSFSDAALRSPAVASVLEMPRDTPAQQLGAVFTLLDLGELDVAQTVWNDFSGDDLEDAEKAALVRQFGTARFLNLARRESADGLEGARSFAERCLQAAAELNRSPERLAELIENLNDDSVEVRRAARSDLSVMGDAGASACLEALARAPEGKDSEKLRVELMLTLARMRPGVEPMLIAALADGRGQFRRDVVELAGYLHLQDAVPWLAALVASAEVDRTVAAAAYTALTKMGLSAPASGDALAVARSEIQRLESHDHPPTADPTWWSFDADARALSAREVSAKEKQLLSIARLSRMTGELPDAGPADRRMALIYAYQASQLLDQPMADDYQKQAESLGTIELGETLHAAMQSNQLGAAIACAILLGNHGDREALISIGGQRSALAAAIVHPDRGLRFAALEAVMKIGPDQTFAGASGVPEALWQFAAGAGDPQVIAASSVFGQANDWAAQLRGLGYEALPVTTGREAVLTALSQPRLELMLIDSDINRPLVREVVYSLRSNPILARVPIALLSSLENLARAGQIASDDPWLLATPRPHGEEALKTVLAELADLGGPQLSAEERTEQAEKSLGWLADLLENGHPYDELLRDADLVNETLYNPELTPASLRLLSVLGTAGSQQSLLDLVSAGNLPIETRQAAADAFAKSVSRYGKLLSATEIVRQYDRYNASETANRETQEVLGRVLDILEK